MYEGLSKSVLEKMLPPNLDLRLVQGFVSGPKGTLSRQIDWMLVRGSGHQLPYTDSFVWPVQDVLAVFEIKKTLYASELRSSHEALVSVLTQFKDYAAEGLEAGAAWIRFVELSGRAPRDDDIGDRAILSYFAHEYYAPIRVVFSYDGYTTEQGLRDGFLRHFNEFIWPLEPRIEAHQFPNLIVCGDNSIVRYNGHPYMRSMNDEEVWPLLSSSAANPLLFLIEILAYRFATDFGWPYPFDGEETDAGTTVLLTLRMFTADDGLLATSYGAVTAPKGGLSPKSVNWQPIRLTANEWLLLRIIQIGSLLPTNSVVLKKWCDANGIDLSRARAKLEKERLIVEKDGILVCIREKLYSTIANGSVLTAFEQYRWKLDAYAAKAQSEELEAVIRSKRLVSKLRRGLKSWIEISRRAR